MKQQEIKVFLAIARHKSISAAAAALHYAQPTVSACLNQLEKSLARKSLALFYNNLRRKLLVKVQSSYSRSC